MRFIFGFEVYKIGWMRWKIRNYRQNKIFKSYRETWYNV